MRVAASFRAPGAPKSRKRGCRAIRSSPMLRFDVGEDLLHYYCNVDRVTVYATAPVNVAIGARILRQIGAGARDGGQEPRAGSIELAEASYRAGLVTLTRVDKSVGQASIEAWVRLLIAGI